MIILDTLEGLLLGKHKAYLTLDNKKQKILHFFDGKEKSIIELNFIFQKDFMEITGLLNQGLESENWLENFRKFKELYQDLAIYFGISKNRYDGSREKSFKINVQIEAIYDKKEVSISKSINNVVQALSDKYNASIELTTNLLDQNVAVINIGGGYRFQIVQPHDGNSIIKSYLSIDEAPDFSRVDDLVQNLEVITREGYGYKGVRSLDYFTEGVFKFHVTNNIALHNPIQEQRLK